MSQPCLLWIDLRYQYTPSSPFFDLSKQWLIYRVNLEEKISSKIREYSPRFLCFEFDYPDFYGLRAIKNTKIQFPELPILMLTNYHSEDLAVWAFRARVWDYLVKPLTIEDLSQRLETLFKIGNGRNENEMRTMYMSNSPVPLELRSCRYTRKRELTLPAISYIEKHFGDKITVQDLANICFLTAGQFSFIFKKERGVSFREFLIQFRINKAKEMLKNPQALVTDIAFTVGFNDLSHFAHLFKRYVGTLPSQFKKNRIPDTLLNVSPMNKSNRLSQKTPHSIVENTWQLKN